MFKQSPYSTGTVAWLAIGIIWFVVYEMIRERRARMFPGQSTQTCLMALIYNCGCLVIVVTMWILIISEILWLRAQH